MFGGQEAILIFVASSAVFLSFFLFKSSFPQDFLFFLAAMILVLQGIVPAKQLVSCLVNEITLTAIALSIIQEVGIKDERAIPLLLLSLCFPLLTISFAWPPLLLALFFLIYRYISLEKALRSIRWDWLFLIIGWQVFSRALENTAFSHFLAKEMILFISALMAAFFIPKRTLWTQST